MNTDNDNRIKEFLEWIRGYEKYNKTMTEFRKEVDMYRDIGVEIDDRTGMPFRLNPEFKTWFSDLSRYIRKFHPGGKNERVINKQEQKVDEGYHLDFSSMMDEIEELIDNNMQISIEIPGETLCVFAAVSRFQDEMPSDVVVKLLSEYIKEKVPPGSIEAVRIQLDSQENE